MGWAVPRTGVPLFHLRPHLLYASRSRPKPLRMSTDSSTARPRRAMYAVIETGGKQYRVELGSEFAVERLEGTPGDTISFERVLLVADGDKASIGTPVVDDALVTASLVRHDRGDKVIVFKYRPKARHRAKNGHRQEQTIVRVADIRFGGRSAADEAQVEQKEVSKAKAKATADAQKKAAADQALAAKLEREAADRT